MTEIPRKNHFGAKIARGMLREQGLLEDDPQHEEPEYQYPYQRFEAFLKRVEEDMKNDKAGD